MSDILLKVVRNLALGVLESTFYEVYRRANDGLLKNGIETKTCHVILSRMVWSTHQMCVFYCDCDLPSVGIFPLYHGSEQLDQQIYLLPILGLLEPQKTLAGHRKGRFRI